MHKYKTATRDKHSHDDHTGGQRRRLSMLLETLANPEILLLDEPTTGLDSSTSLKIHEFLFNLTKTGCACAMTVPRSRKSQSE